MMVTRLENRCEPCAFAHATGNFARWDLPMAVALAKLDDALIPDANDDRVRSHLQTTRSAIAGHLESARGLR